LDFLKNVFPPLEPQILVMWEGIGEALKIVCEVLHAVQRHSVQHFTIWR
jgi:hypothetical protein